MHKTGWLLLGLGLLLAGCSPQQQQQTNQNLQQAGQKIQQGAQSAASSVGKALSNDSLTLQVKMALQNSAKLHGSQINVTTAAGAAPNSKIVTLSGTTPTPEQKTVAQQIATDTVGPNVQIVNSIQAGK